MKSEPLLLPVLLLAVAVFLEVTTRTMALWGSYQELRLAHQSQEAQLKTAIDLRDQFQGIATETAKLAERGNANAATVMERLKAAGITVQLPATPDPAPDAPKP